jgi:hypothetical protein
LICAMIPNTWRNGNPRRGRPTFPGGDSLHKRRNTSRSRGDKTTKAARGEQGQRLRCCRSMLLRISLYPKHRDAAGPIRRTHAAPPWAWPCPVTAPRSRRLELPGAPAAAMGGARAGRPKCSRRATIARRQLLGDLGQDLPPPTARAREPRLREKRSAATRPSPCAHTAAAQPRRTYVSAGTRSRRRPRRRCRGDLLRPVVLRQDRRRRCALALRGLAPAEGGDADRLTRPRPARGAPRR